jgi:surface antigen
MRLAVSNLCLPIALATLLSGCAYNSPQEQESKACSVIGPKAMIGAVGGAAGGAAIGGAAGGGRGAAIGAGIGLLAGVIGGHIMDQQDCQAAQQALAANLAAAREGSTINWRSASGHQGQYQVTSTQYAAHGSDDCRQAMSVPPPGTSNRPQPLVACRMPDGDYSYYPG